jgi:hypothetical protein
MRFVGNMSLIDAGRALLSLPQALLYPPPQTTSAPLVTVQNGTYSGVYNSQYDQDHFLGVPFSQVTLALVLRSRLANSCVATRAFLSSARAQYNLGCYPNSA